MKRYFFLVAVIASLLESKGSFAQYENNEKRAPVQKSESGDGAYHFRDHLFVGGGFVLEFGYVTAIGASPIVGYKFDNRFAVGLGGNYIYLNGLDYYGDRFQTSVYGGSVFARYRVLEKVFAYAEYGFTNYETPAIDINNRVLINYRVSVPDFLVGGGYTQQIGRNSYFEILLLYDLLYGPYSYEPSAFSIRPGFVFGF